MQYFVNTGDGVLIVDSAEKAAVAAQNAIDGWRDCCDPDWPEEVADVCWGPIYESAIEVSRGENGEYADYVLKKPSKPFNEGFETDAEPLDESW